MNMHLDQLIRTIYLKTIFPVYRKIYETTCKPYVLVKMQNSWRIIKKERGEGEKEKKNQGEFFPKVRQHLQQPNDTLWK